MENHINVLLEIIRAEVCGEEPELSEFLNLEETEQFQLAKLARRHSVAQLLGDALGRNPAASRLPVTRQLVPSTLLALNQVTKNDQTRNEICRFLDDMKIPYIPLKGARIRPHYPQPWMRTSCDIDILVPQELVEQTAQLLTDKLGYERKSKGCHDISLFSKAGVHLELHFSLLEEIPQLDRVLDRVWQYSSPVEKNAMEYAQTTEFFLFHLIAHMVHHMDMGGCGIRPFVDLFVLRRELEFDGQAVENLCEEAGILRFYRNVWQLVDVWFCGAAHTEQTKCLEQYIVSGGMYGSAVNRVDVCETRNGGKLGYLRYRIWIPMDQLAMRYPVLLKKPWLEPACQVMRWTNVLRPDRIRRIHKEFSLIRRKDSADTSNTKKMLEDNDLR